MLLLLFQREVAACFSSKLMPVSVLFSPFACLDDI